MGNVIYLLNILEQEFDNFLLSLERPSRQNKIKIIITCTKSDKSLQSQSRKFILVIEFSVQGAVGRFRTRTMNPGLVFLFSMHSILNLG